MDSARTNPLNVGVRMFTARLLHGDSKTVSTDLIRLGERSFLVASFRAEQPYGSTRLDIGSWYDEIRIISELERGVPIGPTGYRLDAVTT